jgi:molecular chaperone GrpE (heat shock protein)
MLRTIFNVSNVDKTSTGKEIELETIIPRDILERKEELNQHIYTLNYCCMFITQTLTEIDNLVAQYGSKNNFPDNIRQDTSDKINQINDIANHIIFSDLINFIENETNTLEHYFNKNDFQHLTLPQLRR